MPSTKPIMNCGTVILGMEGHQEWAQPESGYWLKQEVREDLVRVRDNLPHETPGVTSCQVRREF